MSLIDLLILIVIVMLIVGALRPMPAYAFSGDRVLYTILVVILILWLLGRL